MAGATCRVKRTATAPKTLHICGPKVGQPLPRPARLGNLAQPKQGPGHRIGTQRIEIGQRPMTPCCSAVSNHGTFRALFYSRVK